MRIFDPNRQDLLNIGCGRQFHPDWTNLDLEAASPHVRQHDLRKGIPFDESSFDAVYHSHVLEHLTPLDGKYLIKECYRVLRPGGVLRVVVPDLEQITRLYLESHDRAWQGDERARADYEWMKLELLDQMVRDQSGGMMGRYMTDPDIENRDFIVSRIGHELNNCGPSSEIDDSQVSIAKKARKSLKQKWLAKTRRARIKWTMRTVEWLLGKDERMALEEGLFRRQGEIHRWMYDRFSLKKLCEDCGFENPQICTATDSQIESFESYELDSIDRQPRKPDSLYFETYKPQLKQRLRMAA